MYPSSLSDKEWEVIKKFVEPSHKGRKPIISRRSIIDAIFYQSRTGCQWSLLPQDFPNYKTVSGYYHKLIRKGIWQEIHTELVTKCRSALGKKTGRPNDRYY